MAGAEEGRGHGHRINLYITSLYDRLFHDKFGEDEPLRLDPSLISQVAAMVSLGDTKTRRNIQAASAFGHFKRGYEDRLSEGEAFSDEDQYFFENILQNKYVWEQFGFSADRLHLPAEAEEALFLWAFKLPRKNQDEDENPNIFYKAENIRLWAAMARYDNKHGTSFASQFDVTNPQDARPMRQVEAGVPAPQVPPHAGGHADLASRGTAWAESRHHDLTVRASRTSAVGDRPAHTEIPQDDEGGRCLIAWPVVLAAEGTGSYSGQLQRQIQVPDV